MSWEKGYTNHEIQHFPAIFSFLEYDPFPDPKTLGEKIVAWRRRNGITRKSLARQLGIDEAALTTRELDVASSTEKKAVQLTGFLENQFGDVPAFHGKGYTK